MTDVLTIRADLDVLNHYHKQKSEFHFQQKSDNDFLMFLLDTAVRVISIVQHLAPVIEAVSAASNDPLDTCSDPGEPNAVTNHMDVDSILEDQQLPLDNPSVPLPPPPVSTELQHTQHTEQYNTISELQHISPEQYNTISELEKELKSVTETLSAAESYPPITAQHTGHMTSAQPITAQHVGHMTSNNQSTQPTPAPSVTLQSDNNSEQAKDLPALDTPHTENIAIKPELPVAEVVNIKEELMENQQYSDPSSLSQILSSDHINQLMSNVVGQDLVMGSENTPSYVTAGKAANPLSMLHLQNNPSMLGNSLASSSEQLSLMNALFPNKEAIDPGPSDSKERKSAPTGSNNMLQWRVLTPTSPTFKHIASLGLSTSLPLDSGPYQPRPIQARSGPRLYNSAGYVYTVKRHSKQGVYWWCTNRARTPKCLAAVSQKDRDEPVFAPNSHSHNHPGDLAAVATWFSGIGSQT